LPLYCARLSKRLERATRWTDRRATAAEVEGLIDKNSHEIEELERELEDVEISFARWIDLLGQRIGSSHPEWSREEVGQKVLEMQEQWNGLLSDRLARLRDRLDLLGGKEIRLGELDALECGLYERQRLAFLQIQRASLFVRGHSDLSVGSVDRSPGGACARPYSSSPSRSE